MELSPDQMRLFSIFFPRAFEARMKIMQGQTRFVHYTRAEAALKILRSKSVWMRKTQWMNDYLDVQHGLDCLVHAYDKSDAGKRFQAAMEMAFPGITKKFQDSFNPWIQDYRWNTFVTCLSEHDDHEDFTGRLSMWRAYGADTGVALIVNTTPFTAISDGLGAYSSPVAYLTQDGVNAHLDSIAAAIERDVDFLKQQPQAIIENSIHEAFRFGMICTKHPGFAEEREWRVVYGPSRDQKKILTRSIETVGGVPQPIYSIPLKDLPDYKGIEIPALLNRIIVGPTRFPTAFHEAFIAVLEEAGVEDAGKKVVMSNIPLRT